MHGLIQRQHWGKPLWDGVERTRAFLSKKTTSWTERKWRKMTACVAARPGAASSQRHGDYQTLPGQNAACLLSPQETGKPSLCYIHHLLLCQGRGLSRHCFTCLWMSALQDGMQVSGGGCCMCCSGVKWLHAQTPTLFSWAKTKWRSSWTIIIRIVVKQFQISKRRLK